MFIFCRLKINYDSHEFIFEIDTVANNYSNPRQVILTPPEIQKVKHQICYSFYVPCAENIIMIKNHRIREILIKGLSSEN